MACIAAFVLAAAALAAGLGSAPVLLVDGDQEGEILGISVASLGDINGDGFADVVVGASDKTGSDPHDHRGEVYLFLGSATGPRSSPDQVLIGPEVTLDFISTFGYSVASAGDWNGDGFDDLVVGSPGYQGMGAVFVYLGSPGGISETPVWSALGDAPSCCGYAQSVASAGDVNGDGFGDVIVGNPYYISGSQSDAGRAYVYLGGPAASSDPVRTYEGTERSSFLGNKVAGAGDINADGFDDIIISDPLWADHSGKRFGKAYVYLGSASGPQVKAVWTISAPTTYSLYATDVASAGDVNGDGFGDIIVGDSQADVKVRAGSGQTGQDRGKVYVYLGTRLGPARSPAWTMTGDQDGRSLGWSVASAGDVNQDGFADVIVSAPFPDQGRVYLYLGSSQGLTRSAAWFTDGGRASAGVYGIALASAGDVNGDTLSDVILGFPAFTTNAGFGAGRAVLFLAEAE